MYKTITAFILLVAFSLQILNRVVIYIDYYSNTAAYAKNCENKALPQMHCNGKCQMVKKIKDQDKKDRQAPERKSLNDEIISSRSFFATVDYSSLKIKSTYFDFSRPRLRNMPRSFFHPPCI